MPAFELACFGVVQIDCVVRIGRLNALLLVTGGHHNSMMRNIRSFFALIRNLGPVYSFRIRFMAMIFVSVIGTLFASDLKAAEVRCLRNLGSVKQQRAAEFNQMPHRFPDFIGRMNFDSASKAGLSETGILDFLKTQEEFSYSLELARKADVSDFDIVNLFILSLLRKSAVYFDHQFVAPAQSVGLFRMA